MYLSEEKRAEIRKCIEKQKFNSESNSGQNKRIKLKNFMIQLGDRKFPRFYLMPGMGEKCLPRFR